MIVQHGNVLAEKWIGEGKEDEPHILSSVSKTFTASAVGLLISEGRLKLTDKVISFFPDKLPANVSENLKAMTIRDLLARLADMIQPRASIPRLLKLRQGLGGAIPRSSRRT